MSKEAKKPATKFGWLHVAPKVFECYYYAVKLHVEESCGKWTFWVRHPSRGRIEDGLYYDSVKEATDAAEGAAIDSLRAQAV